MTQKFQEAGYQIVNMNCEIADIYIVNTCTVTNMSDRKSRQVLRRLKDKNKEAIVVAVGPGIVVGDAKIEMVVKEGDRVLIPAYGYMEAKFEGETYIIMRQDEIFAIITE